MNKKSVFKNISFASKLYVVLFASVHCLFLLSLATGFCTAGKESGFNCMADFLSYVFEWHTMILISTLWWPLLIDGFLSTQSISDLMLIIVGILSMVFGLIGAVLWIRDIFKFIKIRIIRA